MAAAGAGARPDKGLLRLLTCGSVDDGKSTLIGRLLYEAGTIETDRLAALRRDSRRFGTTGGDIDFSLLLDGLEDERQQKITIDVAYRRFATAQRAFIVADAPGHAQYTRNMATGASTADLALLLVDARAGVLEQTRRHSLICSLFGIGHVLLAVNKLDLVDYDRGSFERIVDSYRQFAAGLAFRSVQAIPVSALNGDNVAAPSPRMPWYAGPTVLRHLETVELDEAEATAFRFPVQWVNRPRADFRGFAGTVAGGAVMPGERVQVAGTGREVRVKQIATFDGPLGRAVAGDAVTLVLDDEIDVSRGDMLAAADAPPEFTDRFAAHILWMKDAPLIPGRAYWLKLATRTVSATVASLEYRLDIASLAHVAARSLSLNEIGLCHVATTQPIACDPYARNRATGGFILIDRFTNETAAAGLIAAALSRAGNLTWQPSTVGAAERAAIKHQHPAIVWFTGLSGAGKSTIANLLEQKLLALGVHTALLDGDDVRHGLNRDLGFSETDRVENIRRVGEVARLMAEAGLVAICAFISPFRADRQMAREIAGPHQFIEVFVDTPLDECIRRDPKGLYARAKSGAIANFTGLDSPYEPPTAPEVRLTTLDQPPAALADRLVDELRRRGIVA